MNFLKRKYLGFVSCLLILGSCAQAVKLKYNVLSLWSHEGLKSYAFVSSKNGWIACESSKLSAQSVAERKKMLFDLQQRYLTEQEEGYCALYRCPEKPEEGRCISEGSYIIFSKVVADIMQNAAGEKYSARREENPLIIYDWSKEEGYCLEEANLNSCSLVSNYHKLLSMDRNGFFRTRKKECSLLLIKDSECNYDF